MIMPLRTSFGILVVSGALGSKVPYLFVINVSDKSKKHVINRNHNQLL